MDIDDGRHFTTPFEDYNEKGSDYRKTIDQKIRHSFPALIQRLLEGVATVDRKDLTVYTGTAGIAYALWLVHQKPNLLLPPSLKPEKLKETAVELLRSSPVSLPSLVKGRPSFINGTGGFVVVQWLLGLDPQEKYLNSWLQHIDANVTQMNVDDEVLVGRCGLLQCLLILKQRGYEKADHLVPKVVDAVLRSGQNLAGSSGAPPLMFEWHEKKYLGAAHGLAGILYMLLSAHELCPGAINEKQLRQLIVPTVDWLHTQRYPSGNYMSSVGSSGGDKLVHWCHGAPGTVHTFLKAYQVLGDPKYLSWAVDCGEVVWRRGLLQKGYGICHGAAGNAYTFLALHRVTQEPRYLYRAWRFAEWCTDFGKHGCRIADRPFSLFEGLAGTVCFLADIYTGHNAHFPGFEFVTPSTV